AFLALSATALVFACAAPASASSGPIVEYPVDGVPLHVAAGGDGAIWFTGGLGQLGHAIGRITTDGAAQYFSTGNATPRDVAAGPDGALWFGADDCDQTCGLYIERMDTSGNVTDRFRVPQLPGKNGNLRDMTAGPDGAIWWAQGEDDIIGRITTSGHIDQFEVPGAYPISITTGPDGALWFNESQPTHQIGRITTSGDVTEFPLGDMIASQVTGGPDGAVWFTSELSNEIGRITPEGDVTRFPVAQCS